MKVFQRGETVGFWCYIKNWDGNYADPSAGVKLSLWNAETDGELILDNVAMEKSDVGKYRYYYRLLPDAKSGVWFFRVTIQDGLGPEAKYVIKDGVFRVN